MIKDTEKVVPIVMDLTKHDLIDELRINHMESVVLELCIELY